MTGVMEEVCKEERRLTKQQQSLRVQRKMRRVARVAKGAKDCRQRNEPKSASSSRRWESDLFEEIRGCYDVHIPTLLALDSTRLQLE